MGGVGADLWVRKTAGCWLLWEETDSGGGVALAGDPVRKLGGPEGDAGGQDSRKNREADRPGMSDQKAEADSACSAGQALPTPHFVKSSNHHMGWIL